MQHNHLENSSKHVQASALKSSLEARECNRDNLISPLQFCLFLSELKQFLEDGEMEGIALVYSKLCLLMI